MKLLYFTFLRLNKIDSSIRLLRSFYAGAKGEIEVAFSGGKDSAVILQLVKESGIPYRAIYKNTTIDPKGTIKYCQENGCEVVTPKKTFFQLIEEKGLPNRNRRFCCEYLILFKILDYVILGIRAEESANRKKRYKEPIVCRLYKKEEDVQQCLPILYWTKQDVKDFIIDRCIRIHPLYYKKNGEIDINRRLGCIACPLSSNKNRLIELKQYPKILFKMEKSFNNYKKTHQKNYDFWETLYKDMYYSKWKLSNQQQELFCTDNNLYEEFFYRKLNIHR